MNSDQSQPRGMRTFGIIWLGQLISILGSGLTSFALGVWIYQETGQATPFAIAVLLGSLPRILLSPIAGSLADRWNRRWLMIISDSGDALITLSAVFLLSSGNLQVWHIYLIAMLSSTFSAFQEPAYTASITMLVPKKDLARASGMVQMAQSVDLLIAPVLAGFLFVAIGLQGIILIDFITYFFAIGALLIVKIPQPKASSTEEASRQSIWQDAIFGWRYLRQRPGLFGILIYFALINFLLNFAAVLLGPLVLSRHSADIFGLIQMTAGIGMLSGSILMSIWGGPKKRIIAVIGFIMLASSGLFIAGIQPGVLVVGFGLFILMFSIPLASGPSQAIFQSKVVPAIQGRVFAIRGMISRSMMPLAYLIAGPLADYVFEPLMSSNGALSNTTMGNILGIGPGRGVGLMFIISGITGVIASLLAYSNPRIRNVESELPDVLPDEEAPAPAVSQAPLSDTYSAD
jgi:DHA3 family macrolide efflux protein-like MFS transporter